MTQKEELEGLRNANRILGQQLNERDKKDKIIALNWYVLGIVTGIVLELLIR
jgi:hypothetical protein